MLKYKVIEHCFKAMHGNVNNPSLQAGIETMGLLEKVMEAIKTWSAMLPMAEKVQECDATMFL